MKRANEYKKYTGFTFQDARLKMIVDLGYSAYVVSGKEVKPNFLSRVFLGKKPFYQILVDVNMPIRISPDDNMKNYIYKPVNNSVSSLINSIGNIANRKNDKPTPKKNRSIISSILDYKLSKLNKKNQNNNLVKREGLVSDNSSFKFDNKDSKTLDSNIEVVEMLLKEVNFDDRFIKSICSMSQIRSFLSKSNSLKNIKNYIKSYVSGILKVTKDIGVTQGRTNIFFLVGPTGVGKTTTIAKLGAYFGLQKKMKVKFITLDTFKVGGVQQLKAYSDIMGIPFQKINDVDDFREEISNNNSDVILVDTSGIGKDTKKYLMNIKEYISVAPHLIQLSLVVSATTKYLDLINIFNTYDSINYNNTIVTKLDETNCVGDILSVMINNDRKISYITFGQNVPNDIELASENKLSEMIFKG